MFMKEVNITATYVTTRKLKEFTFSHTWTMFMKNIPATNETTRKPKSVTFIHTWTTFMEESNTTVTFVSTKLLRELVLIHEQGQYAS